MNFSEDEGVILPDINHRSTVAEQIYREILLVLLGGRSQIQVRLEGGFHDTYRLPRPEQLLDFVSFRENNESPPGEIQTTAKILLPPLREPPNSLARNYICYELPYTFQRRDDE